MKHSEIDFRYTMTFSQCVHGMYDVKMEAVSVTQFTDTESNRFNNAEAGTLQPSVLSVHSRRRMRTYVPATSCSVARACLCCIVQSVRFVPLSIPRKDTPCTRKTSRPPLVQGNSCIPRTLKSITTVTCP